MPALRPNVSLSIDGGWSVDAGPSAPAVLRQTAGGPVFSVPWLVSADNVIYHLDGWPRKMPGASATNATPVQESGANIAFTGIADAWFSGTGASTTQRPIAVGGTQYFSSSDSGATWDSRRTGRVADGIPAFEMFDDLLVLATATTDVPQSWDGAAAAMINLAGSPPNFAFMVEHKDRMWAAGVDSNKSRLYYTILGSTVDWTGAGSGSIDIKPDDGDVLTGLVSHKDRLYILKGPYSGSIHYVTGSAPTGSDAFALHPFVNGVGCTSHLSLVKSLDDVVWWDDGGVHSLKATAAFGDFNDAFLSRDIQTYIAENLNHSRFNQIQGTSFPLGGLMLWTAPLAGVTTNGVVLALDYRFTPMRWARWTGYSVASLGLVRDSGIITPWAGTYGGQTLRMNRRARNINAAAFSGRATLPFLNFGDSSYEKTIGGIRVSLEPQGDYNFTLGLTRDGNTQQTHTVSQSGTATLGPSSNQFTLGTSTLGGGRYVPQFVEQVEGEFRELQIEFSNATVDQDMALHGIGLELEPGVLAGD
mgnify:CR=1 FL=1